MRKLAHDVEIKFALHHRSCGVAKHAKVQYLSTSVPQYLPYLPYLSGGVPEDFRSPFFTLFLNPATTLL